MKYLPFETITYKTRLKESETIERLSESIDSKRSILNFKKQIKPYEGYLEDKEFKISRVINYRNSFLPEITGKIEQELNETVIHLKFRLHFFILVFTIFWLSAVFIAGIGLLVYSFLDASVQGWFLLPFGMFIFGYGLTMGAFKYETKQSKQFFEKLLETIEVNNKVY